MLAYIRVPFRAITERQDGTARAEDGKKISIPCWNMDGRGQHGTAVGTGRGSGQNMVVPLTLQWTSGQTVAT